MVGYELATEIALRTQYYLEMRVVDIVVKDSAGLLSALKSAHSGDVIQLASGTYGLGITGVKIEGNVTITSLDSSNMATFAGLSVRDSQGLTFKGLEFKVDPAGADYPFVVRESANIKLDGLNVHGSLDGNAQNDAAALMIRNSNNVTVTNSEFQQLRHGVQHLDSQNVTIANNSFHDIQTDGVRGGGSSKVVISGNYFTNFYPKDGEHPDAIQFWTTNTSKAASDITVTGNVIVRGAGDAMQGVFMRDEVGNIPYGNVQISGNLMVGTLYNGISVNGAKGLLIDGNTVTGLPDQKSWISTVNATDVTLRGNLAQEYVVQGVDLALGANRTLTVPTDGGKAIQQAWLTSHELADMTSLKSATISFSVVNAGNLTISVLDAQAAAALREIEATRVNSVKIVGTAGNDSLKVKLAQDTILDGGGGNDTFYGGGIGHNTMIGGAGDDTYNVNNIFERVVEAANGGADTVVASVDFTLSDNIETFRMTGTAEYGGGNSMANKITGNDYKNEIDGFGGDDRLFGQGGADIISGGDGNDGINGGNDNDILAGDVGADALSGDDGADSLSGGAGADNLDGGAGADTLSGGAGADAFVFRELSTSRDFILDFNRTEGDIIKVDAIDANVNVTGNQGFAFIGNQAFHKVAGELRFEVANGVTSVTGDVNGDGVADFTIVLPGAATLQSSDFLL